MCKKYELTKRMKHVCMSVVPKLPKLTGFLFTFFNVFLDVINEVVCKSQVSG